jgi:PAS domain S-box-containing protein
MLGFQEHEIGDHITTWAQLVHPDDIEGVTQAIQEHFAKKTPFYSTEHRVRGKDGNYKWILDRGQALWDEAGTVVRMVGSHTDITERKQAELALSQAKDVAEAATRAKSEFLATMSHELRTPINVILGYSDLIAEREFGPLTDEQSKTLVRIRRNALELHELITSVLDLSRLEAGRLPMAVTEVEVPALLQELKAEIQEAYQRSQLHFGWKVEAGLAPLRTDPQKLKVVLRNLIGNAVKFTPQGSITVQASPKRGGVEVRVSDTGIGISPDALAVIFEPFRQVESAATQQYGGAGLGLHIVKRLLELLGGTVAVESEVGQGSTFCVWVPNAREATIH